MKPSINNSVQLSSFQPTPNQKFKVKIIYKKFIFFFFLLCNILHCYQNFVQLLLNIRCGTIDITLKQCISNFDKIKKFAKVYIKNYYSIQEVINVDSGVLIFSNKYIQNQSLLLLCRIKTGKNGVGIRV